MADDGATRPNIERTQQARADEAALNERDLADAGRTAQVAADKAQLVERDLLDEIVRLHSQLDKLEVEARDLQQAKRSGALIEQASGIVMATVGCTADEALASLVAQAQRMGVEVREIAQALIDTAESSHRSRRAAQGGPPPLTPPRRDPEPADGGAHPDVSAARWLTIAAEQIQGPAGPSAAREFVRRRLSRIVDKPVLDDVVLATSEIVTNAVQHTAGPWEVSICQDPHGTRVRIGVTDTSDTGLPEPQLPAPTSDHGRGLHIVATLAAVWGWTPSPSGGKQVWFELGLQASP
jgi:anti-sigma regulatory factor (Ser/Thr protein kinase)